MDLKVKINVPTLIKQAEESKMILPSVFFNSILWCHVLFQGQYNPCTCSARIRSPAWHPVTNLLIYLADDLFHLPPYITPFQPSHWANTNEVVVSLILPTQWLKKVFWKTFTGYIFFKSQRFGTSYENTNIMAVFVLSRYIQFSWPKVYMHIILNTQIILQENEIHFLKCNPVFSPNVMVCMTKMFDIWTHLSTWTQILMILGEELNSW